MKPNTTNGLCRLLAATATARDQPGVPSLPTAGKAWQGRGGSGIRARLKPTYTSVKP